MYKRQDENYAREEENEKERTSSYRTYLEQKGQKTKMIPSYGLSILLFLVAVSYTHLDVYKRQVQPIHEIQACHFSRVA